MTNEQAIKGLYEALYLTRSRTSRSIKLIEDKIRDVPGKMLMAAWRNEKDIELKRQFEMLIAKKLGIWGPLLQYNDVPDIYLEYLEGVTSIDAIVELMNSPSAQVRDAVTAKYKRFFEEYLDKEEKCKVIKFVGSYCEK